VVAILGAAGIGKSRLVYEFRRSLESLPVTCLEGRCQSYGAAIPYLPVLDILRQNFQVAELDGPETIAEKVRQGLAGLELDPRDWAPYLLQLFGIREGTEALAGLAPGAIKFRTFETLRQMGLNGSRRRPIVFVVEDLQWIDATSEECFAALTDSLIGAPALFLATYRPGYRPSWADKSSVTQIALGPLSSDDGLIVLRSVRETPRVPDRLARLILERADGNPFFIEELGRAVGGDAAIPAVGAVPETIQEVLLARIDRLADEPRCLLQSAAVLGRQVPLPLLRTLWSGPGEIDPHLRELTRLEFLYPRGGGAEPEYAFIHTLTQEVAYESLAPPQREALHATAGRALEHAYAGRLEEVYDRLGHHFSRAGETGKAIDYLTRLADRAAAAHAHREAFRILEDALRHVARLPAAEGERRRLELVLRQAYLLLPQGRFQETVQLLSAHRESLERLAEPSLAGPYHLLLARSSLFLGDDARATESAEQGLAAAAQARDEGTTGRLHYMLTQRSTLAGCPRAGLEHGRQATLHLERAGDRWWLATTYWAIAVNHALLGEFDAALDAAERARALGERVGDTQAQSAATWAIGIVQLARGEREAGLAACRHSLALAPDPLNVAIAEGWLGYAHLERGESADAIPHLEVAVKRLGQFRSPQLHALFTVFLAEAHRLAGRLDKARELADQGLERGRAVFALYAAACAGRVLGRIARDAGDRQEARARLEEALRLFESMEARHEQARTALDLAAIAGGPEPAR